MNNPATPAIRHTGVIGLGALGRPVAELLLKAGYAVAVYDVRAAAVSALQAQGATACASPAAVAEHSELVISLVSDRAQTEDIVFGANGMQGHLRAHTILALGSTLGPEPVRQIATALEAQAVEVLDIPISGGIIAAQQGALSLMVGGAAATLARALPVLRVFAREITHRCSRHRTGGQARASTGVWFVCDGAARRAIAGGGRRCRRHGDESGVATRARQ